MKDGLNADETQVLLQQVPAVYNTQINDVLLTALTRAWSQWSGSRCTLHEYGGPRSRALVRGRGPVPHGWLVHLNLSCPVGATRVWSSLGSRSCLEGDQGATSSGSATRHWLRHPPLSAPGRRPVQLSLNRPRVFNYLGQLDQVVADSSCSVLPPNRRARGIARSSAAAMRWKSTVWSLTAALKSSGHTARTCTPKPPSGNWRRSF